MNTELSYPRAYFVIAKYSSHTNEFYIICKSKAAIRTRTKKSFLKFLIIDIK